MQLSELARKDFHYRARARKSFGRKVWPVNFLHADDTPAAPPETAPCARHCLVPYSNTARRTASEPQSSGQVWSKLSSLLASPTGNVLHVNLKSLSILTERLRRSSNPNYNATFGVALLCLKMRAMDTAGATCE